MLRVGGRRLRVLQIGKYYWPHKGGIETVVRTLSEALSQSVDISVLVANTTAVASVDLVGGIPVTRAKPWATLGAVRFCPDMVREIQKSNADLLHLHTPNPGAELAILMSGVKTPLIVTYHCGILRQRVTGALFRPFHQRLLNRASAILVSSSELLHNLPQLERHHTRCHVVPHGIPPAALDRVASGEVSRLREKYGPRMVLSVGRLVYYKGFECLIRAMRDVEGHLVIVGDGPLRSQLQHVIETLGLSQRITLTGDLTDISAYYHAANLFALPSTHSTEAFGIVQLEAMSCGKPVINTSIPTGVPHVSLNEITGLTVPPNDAPALAGAINRLLNDCALCERFGAQGKRRVETEFSLDVVTRKVLNVYEQVYASVRHNVVAASERSLATARSSANRSA